MNKRGRRKEKLGHTIVEPHHIERAKMTSFAHLGRRQLVSQQHIGDKREDGDDYGQRRPSVHTHGVQVLDGFEVAELLFPTVCHLLAEVRFPGVELDDADAKEDLGH